MTERDKMIEAINSVQAYGIMINAFGEDLPVTNETLADALIAAGLAADVQSLAEGNCVLYVKGKGFMRLYNEQDLNEMIHRAEVAEERLKKLKKTEGDLTVKEELVKYKIAFDKAIKLAYKIRTDFDVLSCSSCEFGYAIDTCKEIGLYNDCENRWKEELLQQTEKELSGEKNND